MTRTDRTRLREQLEKAQWRWTISKPDIIALLNERDILEDYLIRGADIALGRQGKSGEEFTKKEAQGT